MVTIYANRTPEVNLQFLFCVSIQSREKDFSVCVEAIGKMTVSLTSGFHSVMTRPHIC